MLGSARAVMVAVAMAATTVVLAPGCGDEEEEAPRYDLWESVAFSANEWASRGGHYGPAWGRTGDSGVIVFRWEEGRGAFGGSLYTIREDGTGLRLLSPSIGDGRALGETQIADDPSPAVSQSGAWAGRRTARGWPC